MNRFTWTIRLLNFLLITLLLTAFAFAEDEPSGSAVTDTASITSDISETPSTKDTDSRLPVDAEVIGAIFDKPYTVRGITYHRLKYVKSFYQKGIASWYGKEDHGHRTSSGETYNMFDMTAAHKQLPMGSLVRVDCKETGKSVVVRVNDRGPHVPGRVIDLSYAAASELELIGKGLTKVELTLINPLDEAPEDVGYFTVQLASYSMKQNAEQTAASIPDSVIETAVINGSEYFRVKVAGFPTIEEAQRFRDNMSVSYPGALVLSK